jgi:hypothetical protein
MTDDEEDEYLEKIRASIQHRMLLTREKRYDELRSVLDEEFGKDTDVRHAHECEVIWDEGQKDRALNEVIARLKSGNYVIIHLFLGASYAYKLNRVDIADYLKNSFVSKYDETSSIDLIDFVHSTLHGIEPSEALKRTAKIVLHD